jgi:hypothetical protein
VKATICGEPTANVDFCISRLVRYTVHLFCGGNHVDILFYFVFGVMSVCIKFLTEGKPENKY